MHFCTERRLRVPPSNELLELRINQLTDHCQAGHKRLREQFIAVDERFDKLEEAQREDHVTIVKMQATRERRRELSATRAMLLAAVIGGGCQMIVEIIKAIWK